MKITKYIGRQPFGLILVLVGLMSVAMFALESVALAQVNPSWIPTGNLNIPRSDHTATLLPNGKVLVVGGYGGNRPLNSPELSAELYDPVTGSWSVTGGLGMPRLGHTATLLPNGKVLVAGGAASLGSDPSLNSAELYDPNTGQWSPTGNLNTGRRGHTATLLQDGKVLVAGGFTGGGTNGNCPCFIFVTNSAEIYDPATGVWSVIASLNTERGLHTATVLQNGEILVGGGTNGRINGDLDTDPITNAELYDPRTGRWSITASLNAPRVSHTATLLPDGKVLAAAGESTDTAELYDPSTGVWSFTGSLSNARGGNTATLLPNGKVLVVGGGSFLNTAELYDPNTGTWSATASLNTGRSGHTATLLQNGNVVVAGGGGCNDGCPDSILSSAELYDSPVTLWAAVLPSSRSVQVGSPATAFATIINAGQETATGCTISPVTSTPATFTYQTTDPATNQLTGSQNTPLDISPGAAQSFIFALTPTAPMDPTDIQLSFDCANTDPAPIISGLNTLLFSASASPTPDIMALVATLSGDGIVNIPGTNGTGVFAVATVNVGAGDNLTVSADTGGASLPVSVFVCQTDPQSGACFLSPENSVTTPILFNETPTFGLFVAAAGDVSFVPETNRIFVRFKDSSNVTRGLTSVAVRTQ